MCVPYNKGIYAEFSLPANEQDLVPRRDVYDGIEYIKTQFPQYANAPGGSEVLSLIESFFAVSDYPTCRYSTYCKDCDHFKEYTDPTSQENYYGCAHLVEGEVVRVHPNHLCRLGTPRREVDESGT